MFAPVALQLYSVRDPLAEDFAATIERVAAIGYEQVELAGIGACEPREVKALFDRLGIRVAGAHVGIDRLTGAIDEEIALARTIGYRNLVCPFLPPDRRTADGYRRTREELERAAGRAAEAGLRVGYHNHDFEFEVVEGEETTGFELLFGESSSFFSELDTCWVARAGEDPVAWLKQLSGRVPLVHLKDMAYTRKEPHFVEIGCGILPIAAISRYARRAGAEVLIVEQDENWMQGDPLRSARESFQNLEEILKQAAKREAWRKKSP